MNRFFPSGHTKGSSVIIGGTNIALILVIVGALNWGGIGLFGFNTVAFLCGGPLTMLARIIYTVVGLAGLWCVTLLFRNTEDSTGHAPHTA